MSRGYICAQQMLKMTRVLIAFILYSASLLHSKFLTCIVAGMLQERVVQVSRVTKVVKGGKSMSFR